MRPAEERLHGKPGIHSHRSANMDSALRALRGLGMTNGSAGHVRKLASAKMPSIRRATHTEHEPRVT